VTEPFSLVTNVAVRDGPRIRWTLPHWLRVFGQRLTELVIVVDRVPPTGRIAATHAVAPEGGCDDLEAALDEIRALDGRIRAVDLAAGERAREVARRWFTWGVPIRCQNGTPILAFVQAFEEATADLVLRCDCDMLFCERGWLAQGIGRLGAADLDIVEPPRLGGPARHGFQISTRAMLLRYAQFRDRVLPIEPHRVDFLRRICRAAQGRASWFALEEMLDLERRKGRLWHEVLAEQGGGFSLHVRTAGDVAVPGFNRVLAAVEGGDIPRAQREAGWNFHPAAWGESGDTVALHCT
jgi:hypothetical protein